MSIPVFAPDILSPPADWRDAASWTFETFVMQTQTDECRNCGAVMRHANVYRMFTRKHPASTDRRMVPTDTVPSSLSVVLMSLPPRAVPICPFCLDATRTSSTKLLVTDEAAWNEALRRDREARSRSAAASSRTPAVHTNLEDLL